MITIHTTKATKTRTKQNQMPFLLDPKNLRLFKAKLKWP